MDLRQLRSLVTIAEEGQFTRAAERIGIAQSSLSAQIRTLEDELGLAMFDRTTRRVTLTDAGRRLLLTAESVLAEIEDVRAELQRQRGLLSGRLMIGVTTTPGPVDVVGLLAEFRREHPGLELSVREDLSIDLAGALREDRIEIAIVTITEPDDCIGLSLTPLASERLVAVLPQQHPLAGSARLSIHCLGAEPFIISPAGATIRSALLRAAADSGVVPEIAFESRDTYRIRALVAAGLGIGILPESDASSPGPAVVTAELDGERFTHTLSLAWRERRRHSPAAQEFITRALAHGDASPRE